MAVTVEELEIVIQAKLDESVKNISKRLKTQFAQIQKGLNFKGADNPLSKMKVSMEKSANAILKDQARLQAQIQVINAKAQQQIETNLVRETAKRVKAQEVLDKAARAERQRLEAANQAAAQAVQQQKELDEVVERAVQRYNDQFKLNTDAVQKMYDTQRSEILKTSKLAVEQNNVIPSAMHTFQAYDDDYQISAKEAAATLQAIDNEVKRLISDTKEVPSALKSVMDYFGEGISLNDLKENLSQVDEVLRTAFLSGDITEEGFAKSVRGVTENLGRMGGAAKQAARQAADSVKNIPLEELNQKLQQFQQSAASISDNLNSRIELLKQKISGLMGEYQKAASSSGIGSAEAKELESKILSAQASLQRLTAQAEKINRPLKQVKANTDKAKKAAKEYGDQVAKSTKSAAGGFAGLGKIIKKSAAAFGAILLAKKIMDKTAEFVKEGIKSAINAPEIENLFRVSLGAMADEAAAFADKMKKSLGVDQYNTKQMLGTFQNLTTSMGVGTQTAYKMSKSLTILANDMASFYNVSADQTFENLQSALTGESEAVKKYGYVLNETAIKQTALQYGLISTGQEMSEQQKVLARYLTLLQQSTNAQGDMANTVYSLQNQLRILQGNVAGAGRSIGDAFLPFVQAVIPWLNALFIVLQRVGAALASFTYGLFGKNYGAEQKKQQQVITNLGGVADAQTAVGDAAQGAGKKVKEALASFDQLNIIQQESSGGGGGGAAGGGGGGGALDFDVPELNIPDIESPFEKMADAIMDKAKEIKTTLMNLGLDDVLNNFKTFFQNIYNQIKGYDFGTAFKNAFYNGFELAMSAIKLGQELVFPIAVALDIPGIVYEAINTISALFQTLNGIVESVTPGLERFVEIGLVPIAQWVGGKIKDAFKFLQEVLIAIGDWFRQNTGMFTDFFSAIGELVGALWSVVEPLLDEAWSIFTGAFSAALEIALELAEVVIKTLTPVIKGLADFIKANKNLIIGILEGVLTALLAYKGAKFVSSTIDKIKDSFSKFSKNISGSKLAKNLKDIFKVMKTESQNGAGAIKVLGSGFKEAGTKISGFFENLDPMQKVSLAIGGLSTEFSVVSGSIKEMITGESGITGALLKIVPTVATVSGVMYSAFGPLGLAFGAITGIIGAIQGIDSAIDDNNRKITESILYSGEGVKVSEIADDFKKAAEQVETANKPFLDLSDSIEKGKENVDKTAEKISYLVQAVASGAYGVSEKSQDIVAAFQSLHDDTSKILEQTHQSITTALSGSVGEALESLGVSIPQATTVINTAIANAKGELGEYQQEVDVLVQKMMDGTLTPEESGRLEELSRLIAGLTVNTDKNIIALTQSIKDFKSAGIDFENATAFQNAVDSISESGKKAKDSINETFLELEKQIEDAKHYVQEGSEEWNILSKISEANTLSRDESIAEIDQQVTSFIDEVTSSLDQKIDEISSNRTLGVWDEIWKALKFDFRNNKDYIKEDVENEFGKPIRDALTGLKSEFYTTANKSGQAITDGTMNGVKNLEKELKTVTDDAEMVISDNLSNISAMHKSASQDINRTDTEMVQNKRTALQNQINLLSENHQKQKQLLDDLQAKYKTGDASITQQMIEEQKKRVQESEKSLNQMIAVTKTKSPEYQAAYAVLASMGLQGLVDGMEQNKPKVETEVEKVTGSIKSTFEKLDMTSIGKNIMSGIASGVRNGKGVVASAMSSAMSNMLKTAKDSMKIQSPSKVMRDEIGKNIMLGIVKGINQTVGVAAKAMETAGESIKTAAENYLLDDYEIGLMYGIELPEASMAETASLTMNELYGRDSLREETALLMQRQKLWTESLQVLYSARLMFQERMIALEENYLVTIKNVYSQITNEQEKMFVSMQRLTAQQNEFYLKLPEAAKAAVLPIPSMEWSGYALESGYNQAAQEVMAYNTMAESNREVVVVLNQLANRIIQAMRENRTEVNIGDDQIYASAKKGGAKYSKMTGQPAF